MSNWQVMVVASRLTLPERWRPADLSPEQQSRAALFYPLSGAIIGGLMAALYLIMPDKIGVTVQATLLVGLWVWLTGAVHLGGLADSADAFGARIPTRAPEALKDPRLGTFGVCALVMILLLKLALLRTALEVGASYWALLAAPVAARLLALVFMMTTPARSGDATAPIDLRPYQPVVIGLALIGLLAIMWMMGRLGGTALIVVLALWLVHWQQRWQKLFGGHSGEGVGALIEVAEVLVLFMVVLTW